MAGHSKWANIKHKKERADQKKGKIFSRIAKEIISAVKQNGPDPKSNNKLKIAIQKAKANNVPNDVIERNIKKAQSASQKDYFEMRYELYGHQGIGILVDIMTDNKNRIASEIRIATNKCGGRIANMGSVAYNFEEKGIFQVEKSKAIEEELFSIATECNAEDFESRDDIFIVITNPKDFYKVKECLEKNKIEFFQSSLEMVPKNKIECSQEDLEKNIKLIEFLENIEDVDNVFHNME